MWLLERLRPGVRIALRGVFDRGEFAVRDYDLAGGTALARPMAVYPGSEALPSRRIRSLVEQVLPEARDLGDPLPAALRQRLRLPIKPDAIAALHGPDSSEQAETGRKRLAFEELLAPGKISPRGVDLGPERGETGVDGVDLELELGVLDHGKPLAGLDPVALGHLERDDRAAEHRAFETLGRAQGFFEKGGEAFFRGGNFVGGNAGHRRFSH